MDETIVKRLLGLKIKQYRHALSLTQFELGEKADINQRQVTLIETGKSFPSLKTLLAFCSIFNCTLADLFQFEHLKDSELIKKELCEMFENFSEPKLQIIYQLSKNLI